MKKKTFINPAMYALFVLAIVGLGIITKRIIETKTYPNLTQHIATYVMGASFLFGIFYIGKDILKKILLFHIKISKRQLTLMFIQH